MKTIQDHKTVNGQSFDNQIQLQDLLIGISAKFINHDLNDINGLVESALEQIGQFVNADRSYVFTYDLVNNTTTNTHEWCNSGIEPEIKNLQDVPIDMIKDWVDAHKKGKAFYVPDVSLLPQSDDEFSLRNILEPQGIQSLITIPQIRNNELVGFVGFDSVRHKHLYSDKEKDILFVFANMLANVQQRKEQQDIIKAQEEKKELLLKNLFKKNEKLNKYAHVVSHDLKSPLINIYNLVEWFIIDNEKSLSEEKLQPLKDVLFSAEKMDILIKGILDYSIASEDDHLIHLVDLNVLLSEVLRLILVPNHIQINIQGDLPQVKGNKLRLQQLFQNLIQNAVKFIDKTEGIIEVGCKDKEDCYEFFVSDNGIGIKPMYFDKIFDTFTKLENESSSSGIGLSIVRKIVESYSGEIWLSSKEGEGTTFYFTLQK